ncbi:MAG: putative bifunctional diguanylate cyclase/phosphodiesterase [Isosphaeraceae bacterium]
MNEDCSTIERLPLIVLLIEDNTGAADLVRERLDGESSVYSACQHIARACYMRLNSESPVSFQFDWAATLEAGRERLAQGKTDLVLLDLSLPDSRGMDAFRTIRRLVPQLPVVIFTGRDDQELGFQTIHEGGQDFVVKGLATPQLIDKILRIALERKHAQYALLHSEERYRLLFDTIPQPICVFSRHTSAILTVNQAAIDQYGYSKEEFLRRGILDLNIPGSVEVASAWLAAKDWRSPLHTRHRRKSGSDMDVEMMVREVDFAAEPAGFAIITDISERRRAEEKLEYQASHDALTGLANRALLRKHVERMVARRQGNREIQFAFLIIDLDRFKEINDTLGHWYGDRVLQRLCPRLHACVRRTDTVARLGGDEFSVILDGATAQAAFLVVEKLASSIAAPILVGEHSLSVEASIGVALYPAHGEDWDTLLQHADIAMYEAKRAHCGHAVYSDNQSSDHDVQLKLTSELRLAIEGNELELHYQPKLDLETRKVCGVEALIRWHHPREGPLPANRIIALAEIGGLMKPLAHWVFATAASQTVDWNRMGIDLEVAINLTPQTFHDPEFIERVIERIGQANSHRPRMAVEITESAMIPDPVQSRIIMDRLHEVGVKISIDDFGTGYSSLAYLKELPFDEVKIDQSFVQSMTDNSRDSCIVRTIIELGHNLGLRVVGEGVEHRSVLELLRGLGCDIAQGFYLSHPLTHQELERWYKSGPWTNGWACEPAGAA